VEQNYIEWVEISSLEKVGLEGRGGYYDNSGFPRYDTKPHASTHVYDSDGANP
jgi:glucose-6-phosphate 1-dehydrogenase